MPDTPDDIQRKIDHLESQRTLLGDAAVDAAIAALRAQAAPMTSTSQQQQAGGNITNSPQTVQHDDSTHGTATTGGPNYGQNIGVNLGIAIFGRDPKEDERRRIVRYLDHLACALDHVPLRGLEQRTDQRQQAISLPKVYTLLATNERVQVARGTRTTLTTYLEDGELRADYAPDYVLPDQAIIAVEQEHSEVTYRQSDTNKVPVTLWRSQVAAEAVAGASGPPAGRPGRSALPGHD
jgi:hypothetical protein